MLAIVEIKNKKIEELTSRIEAAVEEIRECYFELETLNLIVTPADDTTDHQ